MFGYKIEIWKYDVENYKKAEEHILEMAEKGYELEFINDTWIPLAVYRKTEDTKKRKYSVVPVPWYNTDQEFRMMCEDAGWHMLAKKQHRAAASTGSQRRFFLGLTGWGL